MPASGPLTLAALRFAIFVMFGLTGEAVLALPLDVLRIAVSLVVYFALMLRLMLWMSARAGTDCPRAATLAIALAAVVGPLVEVPALIGFVIVAVAV